MKDRMAKIKEKGFQIRLANDTEERYSPKDFSKIKVGIKTLDDAIVTFGDLVKASPRLASKENVIKAINNNDLSEMRDISNFFYRESGIYKRLCRYMAYLYKYDWFITPYIEECVGL